MSLIATHINKFGIVVTSDSNLTIDKGNSGFGQKVFPIPHLNAALAYSGCYRIDGLRIDDWITDFIQGSYFTTTTIERFTIELCKAMNSNMRDEEIGIISIVHICGYQEYDYLSYLEHWHISNCELDLETGNYKGPLPSFSISNDFHSRLNKRDREILIKLDEDVVFHQFYINGFPPGRMSAVHIKSVLDSALNNIWNQPQWGFNKPQNLFEVSAILELYFHIVSELFKMSEYNALYIGGKIQSHLIQVPQNIDKNNWD